MMLVHLSILLGSFCISFVIVRMLTLFCARVFYPMAVCSAGRYLKNHGGGYCQYENIKAQWMTMCLRVGITFLLYAVLMALLMRLLPDEWDMLRVGVLLSVVLNLVIAAKFEYDLLPEIGFLREIDRERKRAIFSSPHGYMFELDLSRWREIEWPTIGRNYVLQEGAAGISIYHPIGQG